MANVWLTAPQAASLVGIAPYSLHRMARRGELRFQRLGRFWLFERREIRRLGRRLLAQRRQQRPQENGGNRG